MNLLQLTATTGLENFWDEVDFCPPDHYSQEEEDLFAKAMEMSITDLFLEIAEL
jgi:hypothetical protein